MINTQIAGSGSARCKGSARYKPAVARWTAQGKSAGLRTYMLITAAATAFVLLSAEMVEVFAEAFPVEVVNADPTRVVHAIIVGISFIGAGAIMKNKDENVVRNLTTSAGVLVMTSVGIAVALGAWFFAVLVSALLLFANHTVLKVEQHFARKRAAGGKE